MKKIILLMGLILIMGCSQTHNLTAKSLIEWNFDWATAQDSAKSQEKPLLIDFHADWCSWCYRMDEDTYSDPEVAELAKQFICVKIDTDNQPEVAKQYRIRGLPTTMFLSSEAKEIDIIPGYLPPEELLKKMKSALKVR